jgi:hypothetical protein
MRFFSRGSDPFRPRPRAEVDEELEFHLAERIREHVARGMEPEAAREAARQRFGDMDAVRDECTRLLEAHRRAEDRRDWFDDLRQDVRFGVRSALGAPFFSVLAIVTLALGIGANAAVFGVVKSVLLDALPYADAGRLVRVYAHLDASPIERSGISPGVTEDLVTRMRSFSAVAAFGANTFDKPYVGEGGPRVLSGAAVTPGFFPALGVRAAFGRTFTDADAAEGSVVMLSDAAWRREFGADPGVLGRTLRIDQEPVQVVGILPRGFVGPMGEADLWLPFDLARIAHATGSRDQHWMGLVGRLAPGATVNGAQRELDHVAAGLAREYPTVDVGAKFVAVPLRDYMVGETRTPLLVLMASAGFVLLITCANLAGALLSRTV